ncbi:hypothetical protein CVT24_006996 [Panaeolus cyanescens]|uniref:Uncharacterized protein n=1 Tax=Panaeolus cyanescens TaxID=181874 RepID=A0A409YKF8_9AGAR|nr:hypothetical protein CVT24_006996 [Panaeolus cyanescens]
MPHSTIEKVLNKETVPLRTGPPTREELLVHYPAKFTWDQLKTFVNSGSVPHRHPAIEQAIFIHFTTISDLGLLKRDRALQKRYDDWAVGVVKEHGSIVNYLTNYRLRWGERDTSSLLTSSLEEGPLTVPSEPNNAEPLSGDSQPQSVPPYFCWETPKKLISIIQNDWPYSVPPEIEHTLIWTKAPIYHPELVHPSITARVDQDGLWGFTGLDSPPPSPSLLPNCLPSLAEWGITKEKMITSAPPTPEEAKLLHRAGSEVHRYVQKRWNENEWETAWFVNPPRLQSVPGLAHIHVFARRKQA